MALRLTLATLHLLALGIGLGAIWARARAMAAVARGGHGEAGDPWALRRAFTADAWWGIAALVWLATGLWRLFAATEKATRYYMTNHVFFAKMGCLVLVLLLELWPMITLIRWRAAAGRGEGARASGPGAASAGTISTISYVQAALVVAMVAAAVAMARGYGAR